MDSRVRCYLFALWSICWLVGVGANDFPPLAALTGNDITQPSVTCRGSTGNTTCVTPVTSAGVESQDDKPLWMTVFDMVQLVCTLIGCLANALTLLVLYINYKGFSRMILVLLRHQSMADALVCGMAAILILQPFMWMTGNYYLDVLVCYCWHGQALFWGGVTLSTYNLMAIALERYLAVCRPFNHAPLSMMSGKKMAFLFFCLYLGCVIITHGTYIQTRLSDDGTECLSEYAFSGKEVEQYFFGFVIFTYLSTYLIPVVFMAGLYALVIRQLNIRLKNTNLGHSARVDKASTALTKTAITVTLIFIFSIGYDLHYYLLGYTGVTEYVLGTPIQKIGVFLSNLNSVANPFVYALLMPMYRRSVKNTFAPCIGFKRDAEQSTNQNEEDDDSSITKATSTVEASVVVSDVKVEVQM